LHPLGPKYGLPLGRAPREGRCLAAIRANLERLPSVIITECLRPPEGGFVLQDLRFGLKLLWKEKAFSLTALLTLALCIGANTAIFTVLNTVILQPLPYPEPERLATLYNIYPGVGVTDRGANGVPDYLDRKKLTDVFDSVALAGGSGYDVGAAGSPQRIDGEYVTPDYFRVLRTRAALGRTFTEDEAVLGKEFVAVLSHGLWKDMFARDPNVLGKDIRMSGNVYKIIGVMPEGFGLRRRETRVWVPFAFRKEQTTVEARHSNNWGMIARLKPSVTIQQAQRRIDALNRQNLELFPEFRKLLEEVRFGTVVHGLKDEIVRDIRPTLYLLQAAVGFVLLIGCVNIANLMLVRSNIRIRELAVRFSLGAGRLRLARQLLTESVTLAALGGALGLALGYAGVPLLARLGARELPRANALGIDGTVLACSAAVSLLAGIAFGAVPVFHLFRRNLNDVFRQTERAGTGQRQAMWTRSALVVCQVSLAFVLLIGAGLLTLSFSRLLSVDPGFRPERVVTARFSLPQVRYKEDPQRRDFVARLIENVRAIPGVRHVGATTYLPFSGSNNASVISFADRPFEPGEKPPVPGWNRVDAGYFQAMGIQLLQGRTFTEGDGPDSMRVVVIDEFLAKNRWPKGNAVGSRVFRGIPEGPDKEERKNPWTIIGVVRSVKVGDLAEQNPVGQIYFHHKQFPAGTMHVVVRTAADDIQVASAIRREVQRMDSELPLFDVKTMPERLSESLLSRRAAMVMCLVFAGLALLLSAIGIYGVLAYAVTQRTREFGIRVALGASVRDVLGMVVGQGLKLAGIGLAIGIAGAFALTRLMTTLLYDVKPTDPRVFAAVALALGLVAVIASFVPSIRALRIRPAIALRYE
jgi:predicted permease